MIDPIPMRPSTMHTVLQAAEAAGRAIPPAWPLSATVAVNPFLGQAGDSLSAAGARLARIAGARVTMPRSWYKAKLEAGEITTADLQAAIEAAPAGEPAIAPDALRAAAEVDIADPQPLATLSDLCTKVSKTDWTALLTDRIGVWAASYFDDGQALWAASKPRGAWQAWRAFATYDLTPEIMGLRGFAAKADAAPDQPEQILSLAVDRLGLHPDAVEPYFHRLLMSLGGWSQLARQHLWLAEQEGRTDSTLTDLLAVRLFWDLALYEQFNADVRGRWVRLSGQYAAPAEVSEDQRIDAFLQDAADRAAQRRLSTALSAGDGRPEETERPALQAAFCIDVRSEIYRRGLESLNPLIETIGFAGFFGLPAAHRDFASDVTEKRLPVLLTPGVTSKSGGEADQEKDQTARIRARAKRAWRRFKFAAVSSFAFVESAGPLYIATLIRDSRGLGKKPKQHPAPRLDPSLSLQDRVGAAETILRAMSLTENFAPLVLLAGHGASVVNNPHASALQCGACGGYAGDVNARLLAGLLNEPAVREGLKEQGIDIPADTLFLGGLHDTTTDQVTVFSDDHDISRHREALAQAESWLAAAGSRTRQERMPRLPRAAKQADIHRRSTDWAEVRPEWGLAGCSAFIAAPRRMTAGRSLGGRAFLHSYEWRKDPEYSVLELIMTAPVVVASWISLQYYGSTVAPDVFGGGNKLLHNVTGGIGVLEGNGGNLRVGLPLQSVHDGDTFMHHPQRLSVCIAAPKEAMNGILSRHHDVRALFDNQWLFLFALDDAGRMAWQYKGNLEWAPTGAEMGAGTKETAVA